MSDPSLVYAVMGSVCSALVLWTIVVLVRAPRWTGPAAREDADVAEGDRPTAIP